ncbi:transcription factor GTE9-like [Bidens hawaiensis]|uniref:transcription factor GTE9-like n=1 Tax=Bidens hawaiensis TaxID=980011 RepID=UPI00404AC325
MAKKDRFPDACSGGVLPNEESGCSGHDGNENSSGPRKKWVKLSSQDGFGVPIRSVPLPMLASSEKQKWLLRLRSELDQVRTFQKRVDVDRANATVSSSSNIVSCSKEEGNQTDVRKSVDPQAQKVSSLSRGANLAVPETFSLLLRKQCEGLLKKLMTHQNGWVFNKPVDVVALKIPDYFNVIKKPMDLGTVKAKLGSGSYSSPFRFLADVRLTFSNAMTYNPPGNDVHIMADVLSKFFELRWKPIEKKLPASGSQQQGVNEEINLVKPTPSSKKRKITTIQPNPEPVKPVMSDDEKHRLSRELEAHLGDLPDNIINFLRQHGSNKNDAGEDEIEVDIDNLNNKTVFELRKLLDDHIREKQNQAKAEPCVIELLNESGLSNSTMQLYKGNDLADEDADLAGNEPPVSSHTPIELDKGTNINNAKEAHDSDSSSAENELKDVKASSSFSGAKETAVAGADIDQKTGMTYPVEKITVSASDHAEQKPNSNESDSQKDDGDSAPSGRPVSPDKLYRAALLKGRFADTILKAREKTFNQDEKADPEKLRREKEQLENQKRKEKARLQAEAKAAENARRRVEAEAAAEAKRKRDLEREAARQALLKIEKTVEIDEASRFLKDLEMLRTADPEQFLPSCFDEISPEHDSLDRLGSFKFGSSNPLEQLGLYMKRDEHEDEDEEEIGLEAANGNGVVTNDVEEGEIK